MLSLKTIPYLHHRISPLKSFIPSSSPPSFLPPQSLPRLFCPSPPLSVYPAAISSSSSVTTFSSDVAEMPLVSTIEHVVLFKVRDSTDPSKIDAMISNIRSLVSLNIATHLTAGPILHRRSAAANDFGFTHLLHSQYRSKADLATYTAHPTHQAVVKENVIPICDDIMAVDWVSDVDVAVVPLPGSLVRLMLAKPREGTAGVEVVRVVDGVRASVPDSVRVSYGENFSPARAKGYEVGFISFFPGVDEVDAVEGKEEVEALKGKVRPLLESVIVVDYLVPSPASSL